MRTPENLARHELIGLEVEVVLSVNHANVGISGRITDETRNTLAIEKKDGREIILIKEENVFSFALGKQKVRIDGKVLSGRPEDRIRKRLKKW